MGNDIEELSFHVRVQQLWGEEPTYTYECPTFVEMGQKINEIIQVINKMNQLEKPKGYRQAVGAAPGFLGAEKPEAVIRRARGD